ncbi:ribonuclease T [Loktanella sp. 3ANDIMAR09]|uniref:ribonuclease T2 family protein n=1 Tax=Loktanella sp. 3ANDIMAR09 TaxID=1225657 RepID=UPI0006F721FD|nr:ribonuclease T2 [Loktanella sp. 3ANDIMAR09]KQI67789.1 ribonuclease T [Loktanella sp. 3ANDIMAR09]
MWKWLAAAALIAPPALADEAGDFDYYVMALSWSPNWCDREGRARNSPQCAPGANYGWVLHGLWPQYEYGYPQDCRTSVQPPSRGQTAAMVDIMGTSGLAWYQWNKHGSCSGLTSQAYFDLARRAYDSVAIPQAFRKLNRDVTLPASLIEEAFIDKNPELSPDGVTVTCRDGAIQEARICLTRDLEPRDCGADVVRDCTLQSAAFGAID